MFSGVQEVNRRNRILFPTLVGVLCLLLIAALAAQAAPDVAAPLQPANKAALPARFGAAAAANIQPGKVMKWGVAGHALCGGFPAYNTDPNGIVQGGVPWAQQFDLVTGLGATWYRTEMNEGWFIDPAVPPNTPEQWDAYVSQAQAAGVHILAVLYPLARWDSPGLSVTEIYSGSYAYGKAIAIRYQAQIFYYELDNEIDGGLFERGLAWNDGSNPDDYDDAAMERVEAELRGLSDGVHDGNPAAQVMINSAGWQHFGFQQRLIEDGVPFDITAYHWYENYGDITHNNVGVNVYAILAGWGKPIWITENNVDATSGYTEQEQAAYIARTAARFETLPAIEAYFPYELFDEPYFTGGWGDFGIVKIKEDGGVWATDGEKLAYAAYQSVIAGTRAIFLPLISR